MSQTDDLELLLDKILSAHSGPDVRRRGEHGEWCGDLWDQLDRAGLLALDVPEELGGGGAGLEEGAAVLRSAGHHAVPLPLAEHGFLAAWMLTRSGLPLPLGVLTTPQDPAPRLQVARSGPRWTVAGAVRRVPWARHATELVALASAVDGLRVVRLPLSATVVTPGENLAGEPRDDVLVAATELADDAVAAAGPGVDVESVRLRGAFSRALLTVGALERVVWLTVDYAAVRHQFGRPIGTFQAVKQHLVRLASESAAAQAAVAAAVSRHATADPAVFELAAAAHLTSEAASLATALAHQVHGAIGMTEEYELQQYTRRLMSWRQEYGSSRFWADRVGRMVVAADADQLWPTISGTTEGRDGLETLQLVRATT